MTTKASIRQGIFKALYPLINNNKPSGWTVWSAFPQNKPQLPCIVIDSPRITLIGKSINGKEKAKRATVRFSFYCIEGDMPETIEIGKDNVQSTIMNNLTTLEQNQIMWREFDDSIEVEPDEIGGIQIFTGEISVVFGVML